MAADEAFAHSVVSARFAVPAVVLAPMEGVHDAAMRNLMGELGGCAWAVAEFLRVSQVPLGPKQLLAHLPELGQHGRTASGMRVDVQLLGSDVDHLAQTAAHAAALGAEAVDLNFGCPAKTVNRHDGGASLLRTPHRIEAVIRGVRRALPRHVAVSAKLRLGWACDEEITTNAAAAVEGGAQWLTIHGRTKADGYRPPARWRAIGAVADTVPVPVIANGDLFSAQDVLRCRAETGCAHVMLGRGALADPWLGRRVAHALGTRGARDPHSLVDDWPAWLSRYAQLSQVTCDRPGRIVGRLKQWGMLALRHGGSPWIEHARRCQDVASIIEAARIVAQAPA